MLLVFIGAFFLLNLTLAVIKFNNDNIIIIGVSLVMFINNKNYNTNLNNKQYLKNKLRKTKNFKNKQSMILF